jgi:hypothetical protein
LYKPPICLDLSSEINYGLGQAASCGGQYEEIGTHIVVLTVIFRYVKGVGGKVKAC